MLVKLAGRKKRISIIIAAMLFVWPAFLAFSQPALAVGLIVGNDQLQLSSGQNLFYGVMSTSSTAGNFLLLQKGSTPIFQIDYNGNITTTGNLNGGNTLWGGTTGGNIWSLNSGNVGIGTTVPSQRLSLGTSSNMPMNISLGDWVGMYLGQANSSWGGLLGHNILMATDNTPKVAATHATFGYRAMVFGYNDANTDGIKFYTYRGSVTAGDALANQRMIINNSGNVGIGITNPTSKLHVYTTAWNAGSYIPFVSLSNLDVNAVDGNTLLVRGGANDALSKTLEVQDYSGNTDFMVTGAGNVSIGTTTAGTRLYVNGGTSDVIDVNGGKIIDLNSPTNATDAVRKDYVDNNFQIKGNYGNVFGSGTGRYLTKWAGTTATSTIINSLIYDNGTNVGIGTTSPQAKLHVMGSAIFNGTLAISEPDASNKAATKNYVDTAVSGLSSAVSVSSIALTTTVYNGSFSYTGGYVGYDAANRICNAFNTGSHFCRTDEVMLLIQKNGASGFSSINGADAWIADGPPGFTGVISADDCGGWTDGTGNKLGHFWMFNSSGGGRGSLISCDTQKKITCCK